MINLRIKENCVGCTACYGVCKHGAIQLRTDEQGFIYPKFDTDKCINCLMCDKVCPLINSEKRNQSYQTIYAARTRNTDVLMRSSSGGMFFMLASYVIEQKHGVVFGVRYDQMEVKHAFTKTIEGLRDFHGSKYVQSNIVGIYEKVKAFLKQGRFVLFSGTPCQVMALKLYLRKEYENLVLMDIICHSVPSPLIFKEYVDYVERKHNKKLISINMRDKAKGWSHKFYYCYKFEDGVTIGDDHLNAEHWGKLFFSGLITRPSCNECLFTNFRRAGDITLADFWDDANNRPEAYSDKGTSLVIVSTNTGKALFEAISKDIYCCEISQEEALQPCLTAPYKPNPQRDAFWRYHNKYGFVKAYSKFFKTSFSSKCKRRIKPILVYLRLYDTLKSFKHG